MSKKSPQASSLPAAIGATSSSLLALGLSSALGISLLAAIGISVGVAGGGYVVHRGWLSIQYRKRIRKALEQGRRASIFLSVQMTGLSEEDYRELRLIGLRIRDEVADWADVYFYNETLENKADFDRDALDVENYLSRIMRCDVFVPLIRDRVWSSILIETGVAAAAGRAILIVKRNDVRLPSVLRCLNSHRENVELHTCASLRTVSIGGVANQLERMAKAVIAKEPT